MTKEWIKLSRDTKGGVRARSSRPNPSPSLLEIGNWSADVEPRITALCQQHGVDPQVGKEWALRMCLQVEDIMRKRGCDHRVALLEIMKDVPEAQIELFKLFLSP